MAQAVTELRGVLDGSEPPAGLTHPDLLELHRRMVLLRVFDERSVVFQRQGRIGTYAIFWNHEAIQAGATFALQDRDWIFPSYRESAIGLTRGLPVETVLQWWRGHPSGWWSPDEWNLASICVPIGTHVPHAAGLAWGKKLRGEDTVAMAFFGDGATSEGAFHEGVNFAAVMGAPAVFVCNNNQWAISTPIEAQTRAESLADKAVGYGIPGVRVDGLDVLAVYEAARDAVERARAGGGPTLIEAVHYRAAPHATADDRARTSIRSASSRSARASASAGTRSSLCARAYSMPSVPSRSARRRSRRCARGSRRPRRSRRRTSSSCSSMRTSTRHPRCAMAELTLVEAVNDALHTELERDLDVLVMGEDVGRAGGVFRATAGLRDRFGPDRCVDTPLAEAGMLGAAVGLCMAGWKPVCEMQYDAFSYPCLDQLITHVGRYRWRSGGRMRFPITIRMPYGGGVRAPELHDDSPEAYYVHTPGIKVAIPSTPADAKGLLAAAIRDPDPVVVFEPKLVYRTARGEVPAGDHIVPLGHGRIARPGDDVSLIAYGAMVPVCLEVAAALDGEASCEVVDIRSLRPLDEATILGSVAKTGRVVIVHEAPRTAGFGAELAALIAEKAIFDLQGPVLRVTGYDVPYPYWAIEDAYVPSVERVSAAVRRLIA